MLRLTVYIAVFMLSLYAGGKHRLSDEEMIIRMYEVRKGKRLYLGGKLDEYTPLGRVYFAAPFALLLLDILFGHLIFR
jgi:hypothetical protein